MSILENLSSPPEKQAMRSKSIAVYIKNLTIWQNFGMIFLVLAKPKCTRETTRVFTFMAAAADSVLY